MPDEKDKIKITTETEAKVTKTTEVGEPKETGTPVGQSTGQSQAPDVASGPASQPGASPQEVSPQNQPSTPGGAAQSSTQPSSQPAQSAGSPTASQPTAPAGQSAQQPANTTNPTNKTNKLDDQLKKPESQEAKKELGEKVDEKEAKKIGEESDRPKNNQEAAEKVAKNEKVDLSKKPSSGDKYGAAKDKYNQYRHPVEAGKTAAKDATKKAAKQAAKKAGQAIAKLASKAAASAVAAIGWPVLIVVLVIVLVVIIIFGAIACSAWNGQFGKTYPQPSGKNSPQVQTILTATKTLASNISSKYHRLDFISNDDQKYVEDGKADQRLLTALNYLTSKHQRLAISHIISAYKDMPTNPESGSSQLSSNVSAHKDGLAADISQIDFVYKVFEDNGACPRGVGDIVYYSDGSTPAQDSTDNQNVLKDSSGDILQNDTLDITIEDLKPQINANIDSLNQTINEMKKTIDDNSEKIKNNLDETQKIKLTQTNVDLNHTIDSLNELKGKMTSGLDSVKNFNSNLSQTNQVISGLQGVPPDKLTELNGQISKIQSVNLQTIKQIDEANNTISNLNDKLILSQNTLNQMLSQNQIDQTALINQLNETIKNSELIRSTNNISVLAKLPNLNVNLDGIKSKIDNLVNQLKDNLLGEWGSVLGDLTGQITGLAGGSNELLRLICEGTVASITPNTTTNGRPSEAIPIQVSWQDRKPNVTHVDNSGDEGIGVDPRVYSMVYQPEAQKKVHQVIAELLQFPYDAGNPSTYRVTQLITFSKERDVDPFSDLIDKLYGKSRPANFGLFSMPESWGQVHIAY